MARENIAFESEDGTCRGWLYVPEEGEAPYPAVVMAGGWCYVKEIVMPDIASRFADDGIACVLFDYRNLGESDIVDVEQHLDPWKQIEDYRNAISFAESHAAIDGGRLGVWGISYSGGHALIVGAVDPRIRTVVSTVPVIDGYESLRLRHNEADFTHLQQLILEDRRGRYRGESPRTIKMSASTQEHDFRDVPSTWGLAEIEEEFIRLRETVAPNHKHWNTIQSVELLQSYSVYPYLKQLTVPTILISADTEHLALRDSQIRAYERINTTEKRFHRIPDSQHMTLYSDRTHTDVTARVGSNWLTERLIDPYT